MMHNFGGAVMVHALRLHKRVAMLVMSAFCATGLCPRGLVLFWSASAHCINPQMLWSRISKGGKLEVDYCAANGDAFALRSFGRFGTV